MLLNSLEQPSQQASLYRKRGGRGLYVRIVVIERMYREDVLCEGEVEVGVVEGAVLGIWRCIGC